MRTKSKETFTMDYNKLYATIITLKLMLHHATDDLYSVQYRNLGDLETAQTKARIRKLTYEIIKFADQLHEQFPPFD